MIVFEDSVFKLLSLYGNRKCRAYESDKDIVTIYKNWPLFQHLVSLSFQILSFLSKNLLVQNILQEINHIRMSIYDFFTNSSFYFHVEALPILVLFGFDSLTFLLESNLQLFGTDQETMCINITNSVQIKISKTKVDIKTGDLIEQIWYRSYLFHLQYKLSTH